VCLQVTQQRDKWIKNISKKAALWKYAHERNARRVLNFVIEMEGLWVKLGQYLSTRADVLPEAYIHLLKQLQDSLPPRPQEEVIYLCTIGISRINKKRRYYGFVCLLGFCVVTKLLSVIIIAFVTYAS